MKSSLTTPRKPLALSSCDCNDAQDALRQVVQEQKREKQGRSSHVEPQNHPLSRSHSEGAGQLLNIDQRKNTALFASNVSLPRSIPAYSVNVDQFENISLNNILPSTVSEQELYTPTGYQALGSACICDIPDVNDQPIIQRYAALLRLLLSISLLTFFQ